MAETVTTLGKFPVRRSHGMQFPGGGLQGGGGGVGNPSPGQASHSCSGDMSSAATKQNNEDCKDLDFSFPP